MSVPREEINSLETRISYWIARGVREDAITKDRRRRQFDAARTLQRAVETTMGRPPIGERVHLAADLIGGIDGPATFPERPDLITRLETIRRLVSELPTGGAVSIAPAHKKQPMIARGMLDIDVKGGGNGYMRNTEYKDVYVAFAQIQEFGLRQRDQLTARVRKPKEGKVHHVLVELLTVNGQTPGERATQTASALDDPAEAITARLLNLYTDVLFFLEMATMPSDWQPPR